MIGIGPTDVRWTGALLVAGCVLFLAGAAFWRMRFQQRDLQKVLLAVAHAPTAAIGILLLIRFL